MNKKETVATFALISALFPRDDKFANATKEMISAWNEMLADIPFDTVKAAIKASVATSPFPPSICEIRNYAVKISENPLRPAEEAWKIASDAIRKYSTNTVPIEGFKKEYKFVRFGEPVKVEPSGVEYEAKRHVPPEVWEVMEQMGYADMCRSENPDVLRGQFMKIWNNRADREHEYKVIGKIVPQLLENIPKLLLDGGQNGEIE